ECGMNGDFDELIGVSEPFLGGGFAQGAGDGVVPPLTGRAVVAVGHADDALRACARYQKLKPWPFAVSVTQSLPDLVASVGVAVRRATERRCVHGNGPLE